MNTLQLPSADTADRIRQAVANHAELAGLAPRLRGLRILPAADGRGGIEVDTGDPLLQQQCVGDNLPALREIIDAHLHDAPAVVFPAPESGVVDVAPPPVPAAWPADKTLAGYLPTANTRLAFRAVNDSVAFPAPRYTPLVLVGGFCLGKTHLIQGFANAVRAARPDARIQARTGAEFLAEHRHYRERGALDLFLARHAEADFYLLDDLHRLAGDTEAQETLLAIVERLDSRRAQVFFTSLGHPRKLDGFSPRLASRLAWGVSLELRAFDAAARREMLNQRNTRLARPLDAGVLDHLARCELGSIREIDSKLRQLGELADIGLGALSMDQVRVLTDDAGPRAADGSAAVSRAPTLPDIEAYFLAFAKLTSDVMRSACRSRYVAFPRQLAMYCSHRFTHASMEAIGQYYGGRDHSTVKYACEKIEELAAADERTRQVLDNFKAHFGL